MEVAIKKSGDQFPGAKRMAWEPRKQVGSGQSGTIVKIEGSGSIVSYVLDNGYSWDDSPGRHHVGDKVKVSPGPGGVSVKKMSRPDDGPEAFDKAVEKKMKRLAKVNWRADNIGGEKGDGVTRYAEYEVSANEKGWIVARGGKVFGSGKSADIDDAKLAVQRFLNALEVRGM
jgi:hypothetical protein